MRTVLIALAVLATACQADPNAYRDLYADTWVATDALGRSMPTHDDVGSVKRDHERVVGIFYITWHSDSAAGGPSPYAADVSKILAADPAARLDAKHPLWTAGAYHWGEPEMGYFLSRDEWVVRRDMSMLADAGVDVLVMDVTNAVLYWEEWDTVFSVMERMRAEGNKVPQFVFWSFNGPGITVVQSLYDRIYKEKRYSDLWFTWDGKPLILVNGRPTVDANGNAPRNANPHYDPAAKTDPDHPHYQDPDYCEEFYLDYTAEVKAFFTMRTMWWGYYEWAGERFIGTEDNWSFGYDMADPRVQAMDPRALVSTHDGTPEEAAVTPAQHPSSLVGKSWSRATGEPELDDQDLPVSAFVPWLGETVEDPEGYGIYFQERWDEALRGEPRFLYLNDWNEWTAGKYHPAEGQTTPFMRRDSTYFFVDQYNPEFNRCIQPMRGGYTDNYYMQMAQNIRRYRGVRPIPRLRGHHTIRVDGDFRDWADIEVEYRDTLGDTAPRDYPGYGGLHYTDDSGRNDIVTCKVAVDRSRVYFYAETAEVLSPCGDPNWMLLLVDSDQDPTTGWHGYDHLINGEPTPAGTASLARWTPDGSSGRWVTECQLPRRISGKALEIAVPRWMLGLRDRELTFDFHWCDNPQDLADPISLCTHGDSAPNRRFNYRCLWSP